MLLAAWAVAGQSAPPVPEDMRILKAAAETGSAEAQFLIGLQYLDGHGVKRNRAEATKWLRAAAEAGHVEAQFALGEVLSGSNSPGEGVDAAEAEKWFKAAAAQGHAGARARTAGKAAADKEPPDAMQWRLLYSGLRGADAWLVRGFLLEHGIQVNRDPAAALECYREAAMAGHALGAFRVGLMYLRGKGVMSDVIEAYAWLSRAEAQGWEEAGAELATLRRRLTPEELEKADARAQAVKGKSDGG